MRALSLIASDDPERVFEPSILLETSLPPGRSRIFYNHVNGSDGDMVLALVLVNDGSTAITIDYRMGHGGPGPDGMAVGHLASAAFLQVDSDVRNTLAPGTREPLIARLFGPGTNLCGIFEIEVCTPVRVFVAATTPSVAPGDAIGSLRPARPDGYRRSGVFPLRDSESVASVKAGVAAIVGELSLPSTTDTPLKGDYAVMRSFDLEMPEGGEGESWLTFEPRGGPAMGTFIVDGVSHEVARTVPGVAVRIMSVPARTTSVRVVTMAELNSYYPVRLMIQPAAALAVASKITTGAGVGSATGLTAAAIAAKPARPESRVMEPLASRLLKEPGSWVDHTYDVILQLDFGQAPDISAMQKALNALFASAGVDSVPRIDASHGYVAAHLTKPNLIRILQIDQGPTPLVMRVWQDHEIHPLLIDSVPLVKGDAALNAFTASGEGIVWAVLDSGIDHEHPHFVKYANLEPPVGLTHRDYTGDTPCDVALANLVDPFGHGTHVAGIIAGAWTDDALPSATRATRPDPSAPVENTNEVLRKKPSGIAPRATLLSMRVLDQNGGGKASSVIAALDDIFRINGYAGTKRIHGVNLSVGYGFDPTWDACGRTPICEAVNRLVDSGVVVVVAAGNSGDVLAAPMQSSARPVGLLASINDPGNADRAITVASCYNREPFNGGIAASSSKGPTADGRPKPDITAPGERIISCANAATKAANGGADYVEKSGTSMAAPHVSGAIAAYLSVRREFIGRPTEIKVSIARHATDLARDRSFQGAGLINVFAMLAE